MGVYGTSRLPKSYPYSRIFRSSHGPDSYRLKLAVKKYQTQFSANLAQSVLTSSPDKSQELLFDLRAIVRQSSARKTERWKFRPSINISTHYIIVLNSHVQRLKVEIIVKSNFFLYQHFKVRSVQEPCAKCFAVHILKFEILQTT